MGKHPSWFKKYRSLKRDISERDVVAFIKKKEVVVTNDMMKKFKIGWKQATEMLENLDRKKKIKAIGVGVYVLIK